MKRRCFVLALLLARTSAAAGQTIAWGHALSATTTLTVGVRVHPGTSSRLDAILRPLSPYKNARRPNGAYLLPDTRLLASTCDKQHLTWMGVGDWQGPRIVSQAFWFPVGYLGAKLTNSSLSIAGIATYTGVRAAIIPGYHFDPLGYAAGSATWGVEGAMLGGGHYNLKRTLALATVWLIAYPWGTPWADDPLRCQ